MKKLFVTTALILFLFPFFHLSFGQSLTLNQQGSDSLWDGRFRQPGAGPNLLFAMVADSNYLYAAGITPAFGGEPLQRGLSRFDGTKWEKIGGDFVCTSCGYGQKRSLVQDDQGRLYVGGFFEGARNPGGSVVYSQNVIRWNPANQQWEALGQGVEGQVRALALDGDTLYVGGQITAVYNQTDTILVDKVARFFLSTQRWDSLPGGGVGNSLQPALARVEALVVGTNHELFIGGNIDRAGPLQTNVNSIASWTPGSGWSNLNGGLPYFIGTNPNPATVRSLAVHPVTGNVYAGGLFGIQSSDTNSIAIWNGSQWSMLPGLFRRRQIRALQVDTAANRLLVGGDFGFDKLSATQSIAIGNRIAALDLSTRSWSPFAFGGGVTQGGGPYAIQLWKGDMYLAGSFLEVDSALATRNLARWTGSEWDVMGEGVYSGSDVRVVLQEGDTLYAGGAFGGMGGVRAYGLARWDPVNGWQELGGGVYNNIFQPGRVYALKKSGDTLYVGGDFEHLGDSTPSNHIAALHLPTQSWTHWGTGLSNAPGNAVFAIETFQNQLVIGGNFSSVDTATARNLARLTPGGWAQLGEPNQRVYALKNAGDSLLLTGGFFSQVDGNTYHGFAHWDGSQWGTFHQGLPFFSRVWAIEADPMMAAIYLGGTIRQVTQVGGGSLTLGGLVAWENGQWTNPGNLGFGGITALPTIYALDVDPSGVLYVGGIFLSADTLPAFRVARRHPTGAWGTLGQGIQPFDSVSRSTNGPLVYGISAGSEYVYVGGNFTSVGDKQASRIARYKIDPLVSCSSPQADFSFTSSGLRRVSFQDQTTSGTVISWQWDFGDGNGSSQQNPTHLYGFADTFTVTLVVVDSCGIDTTQKQVVVSCPQPQADFSFTSSGLRRVSFQDQTTSGTVISWQWDFGDGNGSSQQNPTHLYGFADTFTVTLVVVDSCGIDTTQKQVVVSCPQPQAIFSFTSSGLRRVSFQDQTTSGTVISWQWDFGDGNGSSQQNPTHLYGFADTFTVTLVVVDSCGIDTTQKQVVVSCPQPQADFSFTSSGLRRVSFQDQTTSGTVISWQWDFGDGNGSSQQNPTHLYGFADTFTVTLVVVDSCGIDTTQKQVVVSCPQPQADFSFTSSGLRRVSFQDQTTSGTVISWQWDFGDGNGSSQQNPTHLYGFADTFTVTLVVVDSCGIDTTQKQVVVSCPQPQADFSFTSSGLRRVSFQDQTTSGTVISWQWDFGDGNGSSQQNPTHLYGFADTFTVTLVVVDSCGIDTTRKQVVVSCPQPQADFSFTSSGLRRVSFQDQTTSGTVISWQWDFGDGNGSSQQNPTHLYGFADTFTVTLVVVDSCGIDTTQKQVVVSCPQPQADFSFTSSGLRRVSFQDQTTSGTVISWQWDFGDGNGSSQQNPTHLYGFADTFTVTLVVVDSCGIDTTQKQVVVSCPQPQADFSFSQLNGLEVQFQDQTNASGVISWGWDFGDGNTSLQQNPVHQYANVDSYLVTLIVVDSCGIDTSRQTVALLATSLPQSLQPAFILYPQPAMDRLQITGKNWQVGSYTLSIWDLKGRRIYSEKIPLRGAEWKRTLQLDGLAAGKYYLRMQGEKQMQGAYFIKGK